MANISISRSTAQQLYELYNNVAVADVHYKRCQSDNFRMHIKSVYQSNAIENAFEELKAALDEPEKANVPETRSNARKSVLTDG